VAFSSQAAIGRYRRDYDVISIQEIVNFVCETWQKQRPGVRGVMNLIADILIGLVAVAHVYFLVLEMFFWDKPLGQKIFRTTPEFSRETAPLAANQGLYNGFLVAGLVWGLVSGAFDVKMFFLCCVVIAGVFGAVTVNKRIFFVQSLPALLASISLVLSN